MSQNLSSIAVVIGALRVKYLNPEVCMLGYFHYFCGLLFFQNYFFLKTLQCIKKIGSRSDPKSESMLFDILGLILNYAPVTNFSVMTERIFLS